LNPQKGKSPYVPRDLLRPMHPDNKDTICDLEEYDAFRDENNCDYSSWEKFLGYYDLLEQFLKEGLKHYRKLNDRFLVKKAESGANYNILKLCKKIVHAGNLVSPLFMRATELKKEDVLEGVDSLAHFDDRLGHVQPFPLADAQRDSASHMLEIKEGNVLAVNGPPGTGKTTMLLSIVATEWIKSAIEDGAPPVIVAASANNQAVTNIIDSFENLDTGKDALAGRWLPEIKSYGSYFPSRKKKDSSKKVSDEDPGDFLEVDAETHVPEVDAIDVKYHTDHFFNNVETQKYVNPANSMFLEKAKACYPDLFQAPQDGDNIHQDDILSIEKVKSRLLDELKEGKTKLKEIKDLWESFCSAHDGIKKCFGSNNPHDELNSLSLLYEKESQCLQACYRARKGLEKFKAKILVCIAESFSWLAPAKNWLDARARLAMEGGWPDFLGDVYQLDYNGIKKTIHEIVIEKARVVQNLEAEKKHKSEILENYLARQEKWIGIITELGEKDRLKAFLKTLKGEYQKKGKEIKFYYAGWFQENSSEVIFNDLPDLELCDKLCDITIRFDLFRLATHYWEARWLIKMAEMLKKPNELKDEDEKWTKERWLRRMMLTPCSVFTLYMLPKNLSFNSGYYDTPLFNFADLLIVDEAGQVPVEIGAPSFALAKRALVVGDTEQIEPIWSVTENIDKGNIKYIFHYDDDKLGKEFELFKMHGKLASSGSLMALAQNLTPYRYNEKLPRGMFLNEHRRCFDEIIEYCNKLCYEGELTPKRGTKPKEDNILPALGYVHVGGVCVAQGGSRKNKLEAQYIAEWIKKNSEALCNKYSSKEKKKEIHEIVGIITPFAAQKEQIIDACKDMDIPCKAQDNPDGVTIGTVHALQGAERNVVIFSSTYSIHSSNSYFFDKGNNMLNVAVSRAKDSFIVFGDMDIFDKNAKDTSGRLLASSLLASSLFEYPQNKIEFSLDEDFFSNMKLDCQQMLLDNKHDDFLKTAIKNAKEELIIVSPWITEQGLVESGAHSLLLEKKTGNTNIDIIIYADDSLTKQGEIEDWIRELRNAGIKIVFKDKIHCKTLIIDKTQIWNGSYNWLSAVRNPDSKYARTEVSFRIDDENAGKNIIKVLEAKPPKG